MVDGFVKEVDSYGDFCDDCHDYSNHTLTLCNRCLRRRGIIKGFEKDKEKRID